MERLTITDPDDVVGLLGIMLGHFDNATGLTEDELYERFGELQAREETNE